MQFTDFDLNTNILQHIGGIGNNSFVQIIDSESDDNDSHQPPIIQHSPYYDIEHLISTVNKFNKQFSIFSTNAQSINAKIDELKIFIECLHQHNFAFSAICIQESWLAEGDNISQIQLEGYICIPQGKSCTSKGGLIIY